MTSLPLALSITKTFTEVGAIAGFAIDFVAPVICAAAARVASSREFEPSPGGEDGGRHARLIDQDMNRERLYILGLAEAKSEKGRLLQLVKSEIKANKEVNTWAVLD